MCGGGWHVCALPKQSLQSSYVDIVIVGLGQKIFPQILKCIDEGQPYDEMEGVATLSEDGEFKFTPQKKFDLSGFEIPDFDAVDLDWYREESKAILPYSKIDGVKLTGYLYYPTSFGCPFACSYCCNFSVFGGNWYGYKLENVMDQLEYLINEKEFNCVSIIDAEFFMRVKRLESFLDEVIRRKLDFIWDAQASVKAILVLGKRGLFKKIRESGCWRMNIGAESGSQNMLDYMNKKITREDILQAARYLNDNKITGCFNFLFGVPAEGYHDLKETFSLAYELKKINSNSPMPVSFYSPMPGTPIFDDSVEKEFVPPKNFEEWGEYKTNYLSLADIIPWRNKRRETLVYDAMTFYIPIAVPGDIGRGTITYFNDKLQNSPFKLFLRVAHKLALFRVKTMCFIFPFERWIFDLYCKLSKKGKYVAGIKWATKEKIEN